MLWSLFSVVAVVVVGGSGYCHCFLVVAITVVVIVVVVDLVVGLLVTRMLPPPLIDEISLRMS